MRLFAIALLIPVAFVVGRATNPTPASANAENRVYTLRQNDVVRAPSAATRCTAGVEGGVRNLFLRALALRALPRRVLRRQPPGLEERQSRRARLLGALAALAERSAFWTRRVPKVGIEPTRPFGHRILSPARLPVPPLRLRLHGKRYRTHASKAEADRLKIGQEQGILAPVLPRNSIGLEEEA
jgi:hypothetical protein